MADVALVAPKGDPAAAQYESRSDAMVRNLTSGKADAKVYVMVVKTSEGVELVYFEPDEKYLDAVCMKNGHKVRR